MKKRALRVWDRMQEMFGNTFTTQYGHVPLLTWTQAIDSLSDEQLFRGLRAVAMSGDTFPPTLPKFVALCRNEADQECRVNPTAYKQLPANPPETEEHRAARIERGKQEMAELKAKLRGKA